MRVLTLAVAGLASLATHSAVLAAPVAVDDYYILDSTVFSVGAPGVLGNDSGDGTLFATSYFPPDSGNLSLITDGSFVYTPEQGFAGIATWQYFMTDDSGETSSATVRIDASTNLPVANPDSYILTDVTLQVAPPGLLANDTGGIGDLMAAYFFPPGNGTLNLITDGSFMYSPNDGFTGVDSFRYGIRDSLGRVAEANVFLDVEDRVPVPEPSSLALLALGLASIAGRRRRRNGL